MCDQRFSKHRAYPNWDLHFWGKTHLNKNFVWICSKFYPLNKIFWGGNTFWRNRGIWKMTSVTHTNRTKKVPFISKTGTFWPLITMVANRVQSKKKHHLFTRFSGHACVQHYYSSAPRNSLLRICYLGKVVYQNILRCDLHYWHCIMKAWQMHNNCVTESKVHSDIWKCPVAKLIG